MLISRRIGSKAIFDKALRGDEESVVKVMKSFRGPNVSVYKVQDFSHAELVMLLHAATNTDSCDRIDWVEVPDDVFENADIILIESKDPSKHSSLSECHWEIAIDDSDESVRRVVDIVISVGQAAKRIQRSDAKARVRELLETDIELKEKIKPSWATACS